MYPPKSVGSVVRCELIFLTDTEYDFVEYFEISPKNKKVLQFGLAVCLRYISTTFQKFQYKAVILQNVVVVNAQGEKRLVK